MGLSGHVCLPAARCLGLVVLLTGTQHCFLAATTVTGSTRTTDTTRTTDITDVTHITGTTSTTDTTRIIDITDVTHITGTTSTTSTTSTAPSTAATSTTTTATTTTATTTTATTTTATTTTPETTSNPNHFLINLNTSCVTGKLKVNLSFFNDSRRTIDGTCDGDTQYVKDFINLLTQDQTITTTTTTTTNTSTTTTPSTTTTSTDGTTASSTTSTTSDHCTESCTTCANKYWSGVGTGAGAVVLPCLVSLLLYVFRRRICSPCRRRKELDDVAGTGRTESDTSGQRPCAGTNPFTSTSHDSLEAETDLSRSGYGNTGLQASSFEGIPALPRKTSVFSIHEDDDDNRGNSFNGFFVPEPNQAPESDYDVLPVGRKPSTTAAVAGEDDEEGMQTDYMNVLEARDAHAEAEQEDYINYPAISC